jgi:hypothetical protein
MESITLAQFADKLIFSAIALIGVLLWAGFVMALVYLVLKLFANGIGSLVNAARGIKSTASEAEPGLAPKKTKKAAVTAAPREEPSFREDDAEEMEAAHAAVVARAVANVQPSKPEPASSELADRLADEFDARPVSA